MDLGTLLLAAYIGLLALPSVPASAPERVALTGGTALVGFTWGDIDGQMVGIRTPFHRGAKLRAEAAVNLMHVSGYHYFRGCHLLTVGLCEGFDDYRAVETLVRLEPVRTWTGMRPYVAAGYVFGTLRSSEDEIPPTICFTNGTPSLDCPPYPVAKIENYVQSVRHPVWSLGFHWTDHLFGVPIAGDFSFTPAFSWTRHYRRMTASIGTWY